MIPELLLLISTCAPQVHPSTMLALVHHESRANPFAIGINGGDKLAKQPKTREQAVEIVKDLITKGIDFDAGLGQINVRNWNWLNLSAETVFEPCTNLKASQTVLADCYVRATNTHAAGQSALQAALSCYNTGNFNRGLKNGYVHRVYAAANQTVPDIQRKMPPAAVTSPSASATTNSALTATDSETATQQADQIVHDGFTKQPAQDGFQPSEPTTPAQ